MTNLPYHIALVDDHLLVRRGLRRIVEANPDFRVVAEFGDGLELLKFLQTRLPHLVVLDISMPRMGGIEAARHIKANYPQVKILMLTMFKDQEYQDQAKLAGAEGYLLKEDADAELLQAISSLRRGETYLSPLLRQP